MSLCPENFEDSYIDWIAQNNRELDLKNENKRLLKEIENLKTALDEYKNRKNN